MMKRNLKEKFVYIYQKFKLKLLPNPGDNTKITFGILGDIGQTIHSISTINNLIKEPNIDMILQINPLIL